MVSSSPELPEGRMSDERLQRLEEKVDILVSGQIDLRAGQADLVAGHARLEMRVSKVEERLGDLAEGQEELRAAVMQIAEGHAAQTRQLASGFTSLHAALDHRRGAG
jgi:regulator of replication initiation timing